MSMTWLHSPLEPWTQNSVSVSRENCVSCDENNKICISFYQWSKIFFQDAATTLRLTAIKVRDKTANNNGESVTQIREAFEEFYRAIKEVDDEFVLAIDKINRKIPTESIQVSASLCLTLDPLSDESSSALVVEKLWSEMKSIMKQAIEKMSPGSKWRVLFEKLINSGEKHSSDLQILLKENSL